MPDAADRFRPGLFTVREHSDNKLPELTMKNDSEIRIFLRWLAYNLFEVSEEPVEKLIARLKQIKQGYRDLSNVLPLKALH
mmetsp:Transcript_3959/g.11690  ORF Transcript_3959/g.11690 Transcript_3959/m.11690 type:complete len:81 (-) Transcript_3959:864-1106(-)